MKLCCVLPDLFIWLLCRWYQIVHFVWCTWLQECCFCYEWRFCSWCFDNCWSINLKKTKLILYGSRQMTERLPQFHLSLFGKELAQTQSVKDFGVTFDKNVTHNNHVVNTVSSCISALGKSSRVKHVFKEDLRITVINPLVLSKLYYCSLVWSNTTDRSIRKLQSVQNFAACILSDTKIYNHISPVFKGLRWLLVKTNLHFRGI